jgi:hypothetical protein
VQWRCSFQGWLILVRTNNCVTSFLKHNTAAVLLMIPRFVVIAFVVTAFGAQSSEMVGPVMLTVALLVLLIARARFRRRLGGGGVGKLKKAE